MIINMSIIILLQQFHHTYFFSFLLFLYSLYCFSILTSYTFFDHNECELKNILINVFKPVFIQMKVSDCCMNTMFCDINGWPVVHAYIQIVCYVMLICMYWKSVFLFFAVVINYHITKVIEIDNLMKSAKSSQIIVKHFL